MLNSNDKENEVQDYYGKELKSSDDLKTNVCCTVVSYPTKVKKALGLIHNEVMEKYYGCGLTIPTKIANKRILDLGSGSGRDCYLLSQLVGENGYVIGVDMTDEQLGVARKHISYHTDKFGYKEPNIEFVKGNIQDLKGAGIETNDIDIIISNCVVNLATNKKAVLSEAYRVLREGGEFYFSDIYCDRRIPQHLVDDKDLYGECLSGALYWNDFQNLSKEVGFKDPRVVESHPITIENAVLQRKLEGFNFYSVTYRLFKIQELDAAREDYGQAIVYQGRVEEEPNSFRLDDRHVFVKGKVEQVCGNTWRMLSQSRYKDHFDFIGNFETHYGIFKNSGMETPFQDILQQTQQSPQADEGSCC